MGRIALRLLALIWKHILHQCCFAVEGRSKFSDEGFISLLEGMVLHVPCDPKLGSLDLVI